MQASRWNDGSRLANIDSQSAQYNLFETRGPHTIARLLRIKCIVMPSGREYAKKRGDTRMLHLAEAAIQPELARLSSDDPPAMQPAFAGPSDHAVVLRV